jgi:hypothetical protein
MNATPAGLTQQRRRSKSLHVAACIRRERPEHPVEAEVEESEDVQPVVDRHDDDVAEGGEVAAVERGATAAAGREPASVQPDHHRTAGLWIEVRGVDV